MKRIVITVVAVIAVAFASLAIAGTTKYSGTVDQGGTVKFKIVKHNGNTIARGFHWKNVPVTCQTGTGTTTTGNFTFSTPVNNGHFEFHGSNSSSAATAKGDLRKHGKAAGTINVHGNLAAGSNCHTGKDKWHAAK